MHDNRTKKNPPNHPHYHHWCDDDNCADDDHRSYDGADYCFYGEIYVSSYDCVCVMRRMKSKEYTNMRKIKNRRKCSFRMGGENGKSASFYLFQ